MGPQRDGYPALLMRAEISVVVMPNLRVSLEQEIIIHLYFPYQVFFFYFLIWYWGLNPGPCICLSGAPLLEHVFALVIFSEKVSCFYLG
jgi:hypothetical protein